MSEMHLYSSLPLGIQNGISKHKTVTGLKLEKMNGFFSLRSKEGPITNTKNLMFAYVCFVELLSIVP